MISHFKFAISIAALSFALATSVHAGSLVGDQISTDWNYPTVGTHDPTVTETPGTFFVGAGSETLYDIENGNVLLTADFDAYTLVLKITGAAPNRQWISGNAQNGPVFTILAGNPFPDILGTSTSNGGSISAYLLNGELIVDVGNWGLISVGNTATVQFDSAVATTPLPAALPLFAAGLGLLGFVARRSRRRLGA